MLSTLTFSILDEARPVEREAHRHVLRPAQKRQTDAFALQRLDLVDGAPSHDAVVEAVHEPRDDDEVGAGRVRAQHGVAARDRDVGAAGHERSHRSGRTAEHLHVGVEAFPRELAMVVRNPRHGMDVTRDRDAQRQRRAARALIAMAGDSQRRGKEHPGTGQDPGTATG